TPGIAVNIIRLLSRRIRELNLKLNAKEVIVTPETARVAEMR
ncbi:transcriptional regulator, partial [Microcoleus sp. herbarium8]